MFLTSAMCWSMSSDTAVSAGVSLSASGVFFLGGALLPLETVAGLRVAAGLGAAAFLRVFPAVDFCFEEFRRRGACRVAGLFELS